MSTDSSNESNRLELSLSFAFCAYLGGGAITETMSAALFLVDSLISSITPMFIFAKFSWSSFSSLTLI